jgi:hypothetical protein
MANELIALFELEETEKGIAKATEKHYRLVSPDQLSPDDLATYRIRTE